MADMTFKADLLPSSDLEYNLGSSTQQWAIYGALEGTATYAVNANYATSAGSASYSLNAASANYALNASSATYANSSNCASHAIHSGSAGYALNAASATYANSTTSASQAIHSASANYSTSAAQATHSASAAYATKATQDGSGNTITSSYLSRQAWWKESDSHSVNDLRGGCTFVYTTHSAPVNGTLVSFDCSTNSNYTLQLMGKYNGTELYYRTRNGDNSTWNSWLRLVHNSGTWGINITGSAGSVAWGNVTGKPNRAGSDSDGGPAQVVKGAYTSNGGRQNPNYFGVNKVGFLMMNTTVNGNSHYKDWIIMDCYNGNDVGGGVALGVNRQALGAYIMRSAAARSSWAESAELIGTHNYTSYTVTKTGGGASGTWGINITGQARSVRTYGADVQMGTSGSSSNDSGDLVWLYGNGNEKSRIWTDNEYSSGVGPNYRVYNSSGTCLRSSRLWALGEAITGAVWNDYAEYRQASITTPGYILCEQGDGTLAPSTKRCQEFAGVSSDTWGFAQGETETAKTPIAVSGRVLVYVKDKVKVNDYICTGPNGIGLKMRWYEKLLFPHRVVGIVSEIPTYEKWGGGENADRDPVDVNGRIWIKCCS